MASGRTEPLNELLSLPRGSGIRRGVEAQNPTPVETQGNEAVEDAERYRRHAAEVGRVEAQAVLGRSPQVQAKPLRTTPPAS